MYPYCVSIWIANLWVFWFFLESFCIYANKNVHIHEHICDVIRCNITHGWLVQTSWMNFWLAPPTPLPEQRYGQNRETANVGQDSSVGRAPARQSGGCRSQCSNFFFVHPNLSKKMYPVSFHCGSLHGISNIFTRQFSIPLCFLVKWVFGSNSVHFVLK